MKTLEDYWQQILAVGSLVLLWLLRLERLAKIGQALYAVIERTTRIFKKEKDTMEFKKTIGSLGGVGILEVKLSIVDGLVAVGVGADLPAVITAAALKTENKIDDVPAAIVAGALKTVTKEIVDIKVGTIHGIEISHLKAELKAGALSLSFQTDIPAIDHELAKETQTKIDDVIAELLSQVLVLLT